MRFDRHAGADLLQIAVDDLIALGRASPDRHHAVMRRAERDNALLDHIVLADDIQKFAELARPQGRLRNHQRIGIIAQMQPDADILARGPGSRFVQAAEAIVAAFARKLDCR